MPAFSVTARVLHICNGTSIGSSAAMGPEFVILPLVLLLLVAGLAIDVSGAPDDDSL